MSNFLSLKWRCNITTCNNTHRIDFNTPSITLDSLYKRFISRLENPQDYDWYTDAPHEQTINVRDNINKLLIFVNQHTGDSDDYVNLKSSITQLHTQHEQLLATLLATQLANDGKKRKSKKRKSKRSIKRKRKSKRSKRSKRKNINK